METTDKKKSPYGVLSLTLGIISIVYALFWYISLPTGILAINLGIKGKAEVGSKLATAGKVTGIVGLSIMGALMLLKTSILVIEYLEYIL